jgi:hypothetical protein
MERKNLNSGVIQVDLSEEILDKNKKFTRDIGGLGLSEGRYLFERLNCNESFARQKDPNMTLDKYLGYMKGSEYVILQIRDDKYDREISLAIMNTYKPEDTINNLFLWYKCGLIKDSLLQVKQLYEDTYRTYFPQNEFEKMMKNL